MGSVIPSAGDGEIETFCNRVTSLILVDEAEVSHRWEYQDEILDYRLRIESIARHFNVSEAMIAVLLRANDHISQVELDDLLQFYQERFLRYRRIRREQLRESDGGPSPYLLRWRRLSKTFSSVVLSAYYSSQITPTQLFNLTGVKMNNLQRFSDAVGVSIGRSQ